MSTIPPPRLRDVSTYLERCSRNPVFRLTEVWQISILKDDDVLWCIVLAYLNSFSVNNKSELANHLKCLGVLKDKKDAIKNSIKNYNPFLNKSSCFYDDDMAHLVELFRGKIDKFHAEQKEICMHPRLTVKRIQASSYLLSCNIILLWDNIRVIYPDLPAAKMFSKALVLFVDVVNGVESFSFGMSKELGEKKQQLALQAILKKANIDGSNLKIKDIMKLYYLPGIRENFLISLLKNEVAEIIPSLYKSLYILQKLEDAGFNTDPTGKGNEKYPALYYAVRLGKSHLLYFLYDHAANACLRADGTIRSPNPIIIECLLFLKNHLSCLKDEFSSTSEVWEEKEQNISSIDELCSFNSFQIEICRKIIDIRQKLNFSSLSDTEFEAEQRKDLILSILRAYENYFCWGNSKLCSNDKFTLFNEFYKRRDYFDNLDFCCAILFFDNLFSLKERLKIEGNLYSRIESRFFLFIYCAKYFERLEIYKSSSALVVFRMVIFQQRLLLLKNIKQFADAIEKIQICRDNVVSSVPEEVVQTLTDLPQIYNEFFHFRLQRYLTAAMTIPIKDVKSILVIERALQVFGESLNVNVPTMNSVQKMLQLSLPHDVARNLKKIRNHLSHMKSFQVDWRNATEEHIKLFSSIQKELKKLYDILVPVFEAQEKEMEQFILLMTLKAVRRAAKKTVPAKSIPSLRAILASSGVEEMKNDSLNFHLRWREYFTAVFNTLRSRISIINQHNQVLKQETVFQYKYILENILHATKEQINSMETDESSLDEEEGEKIIDEHMYCIEFLLHHITTDANLKSFRREFLNNFKARNAFSEKYRKQKRELRKAEQIFGGGDWSINGKNREACLNPSQNDFAFLYNNSDSLTNSIFYADGDANADTESASSPLSRHNSLPNEEVNTSLQNLAIGQHSDTLTFSDLKSEVRCIFEKYELLTEKIFKHAHPQGFAKKIFDFENVHKLQMMLCGSSYLNENEKKNIKKDVQKCFIEIHRAKERLVAFLSRGNPILTEQDVKKLIFELPIKEKDKKYLISSYQDDPVNALDDIKTAPDYYGDLLKVLDKCDVSKTKYLQLCDKLNLSSESENMLHRLVKGENVKIPGNMIIFLQDRIKQLKLILIDENEDIKQLWVKGKSKKSKSYIRDKVVQLYLTDAQFQAAVEMLLFDCMNLLERKDLKNLWRKTSNLFNGINLRNVLAHGNPLFESVGKLLDPEDLPSELARMMLQLVSDGETVNCMVQILEKSGADFTHFLQIMNDDDDREFEDLRKQIKECERWTEYAILIPDNSRNKSGCRDRKRHQTN